MKVLVTGSAGFIGGYLVTELLSNGYTVYGIDNFSKYGKVSKNYDNHPDYLFTEGDVKDTELLKQLISECDQIVSLAAMIGGISYFHTYPYDLLAENERINASVFDAAIWAYRNRKLKKINVISSSMVYENTDIFPSGEDIANKIPPPSSTYGFQKLSCEYFAKGAFEQYKLPYTIIRPFNCIGTGELVSMKSEGNRKMSLSHVVPDLIRKILSGSYPVPILGDGNQIRHYTYGGDLARGIRLCIESDKSYNEDFNLSTDVTHSVLDIAEIIFRKIYPEKTFRYISKKPCRYDVRKRIPDTRKAEEILGFRAVRRFEDVIEEIIDFIRISENFSV